MTPEPLRIAALTYAGYAARLLPDCLVGPTLESDAEDAAWERGKAGQLPDSAEYERGRQSVLSLVREQVRYWEAQPTGASIYEESVAIVGRLQAYEAILRACGDAAAGE